MVSLQNESKSLHSQDSRRDSLRLRSSARLADGSNKRSQLLYEASSSFDATNENKYRFRCTDCPYKTNHFWTFNKHKLVHNRRDFSCDICQYKTSRLDYFQSHKQGHDQPGVYSCPRCNFQSTFVSDLHRHTCSYYFCPKCPFKTNTKVLYKNHIKTHSVPFPSNSEKSSFQKNSFFTCTECDFRTRVKGSMKLHQLIHVRPPLTCTYCDFTTTFKKLLTLHERSHFQHNSDRGKDTLSKPSSPPRKPILKSEAKFSHKNVETTRIKRENDFTCPLCDFSSSSDTHFKVHLGTHDDDDCGKQASPDSTIKKIYVCPLCSFDTTFLVGWKRHIMRMHFSNKISRATIHMPTKNETLTKADIKDELRKNLKWSIEEKKEVYWCHMYAKHEVFERMGVAERRRDMLLKRGILDPKKIHRLKDSRFQTMMAKMKMGQTMVKSEELKEIEESVDRSIQNNEFLHLEAYPRIKTPLTFKQ